MGKSIDFFGEKGQDGIEVVKTAGKAIVVVACVTVVGVAVGVAGHLLGGE
jgi:hypothetical protein